MLDIWAIFGVFGGFFWGVFGPAKYRQILFGAPALSHMAEELEWVTRERSDLKL